MGFEIDAGACHIEADQRSSDGRRRIRSANLSRDVETLFVVTTAVNGLTYNDLKVTDRASAWVMIKSLLSIGAENRRCSHRDSVEAHYPGIFGKWLSDVRRFHRTFRSSDVY